MPEVRLSAELRTEFGKGGARRTRRAGKLPAVIYGHGADPQHVSISAHEFANAVRHGGAHVLLTLELDGKDQLTIPKAIQRHAVKGTYNHVDLLAVRTGEKVTIEVPLNVVGAVVPGGLLAQEIMSVSIEAEATHLPSEVEVSVEGLQIGTHIAAGDLTLPAGVTLVNDPEQVLMVMQEAPSADQLVEEESAEVAAPTESSADEGGSEGE